MKNTISTRYQKLSKKWSAASVTGSIPDEQNPLFIFQMANTKLLQDIVTGKLNPVQLALIELDNRSFGNYNLIPEEKEFKIHKNERNS